ncbi:MAG TPA: hypothetical protein VJ599_08920 [Nitrososphaeraceae archaeon]|nr:hypothetical protein [Nitrososphaeraceae archaeon]
MKQFVDSKLNPEIREMLLGHKIGLASAYYKPTVQEMLNEYEKAINSLTINEENRLRKRIEQVQIEKSLKRLYYQRNGTPNYQSHMVKLTMWMRMCSQ